MTALPHIVTKFARQLVQRLPLPIATPVELRRAPVAPEARPLLARRAVVLGSDANPATLLSQALEQAGATVTMGAPAHDADILVYAIAAPATYEVALRVHRDLHEAVSTLRPHGRLLFVVPTQSEILIDAIHGFVRSLAREVGRRGITVNAVISPDQPTATSLLAFLASDKASFVTGQSLRVQAGPMLTAPEVKPALAVVTGGARGIGASCATYLAAAGYRVAVLDVPTQQEAGVRLCARLGGEPAGMVFLPCDVLDGQAVDEALERARTLSPQGAIDVLVNNAGITRDRTFRRMAADDWDAVLHVNLKAVIDLSKLARERLARGARIVNVASLTGLAGNFGQTNYATAKGGVIGFTKHAARELEPIGVCVTAVAPGLIDTAMTAKIPPLNREVAKQMTSLAQTGVPADVAAAVEFLARREAWPLRGQVLRVDGGMFFGA